jgi:hypothetical protein
MNLIRRLRVPWLGLVLAILATLGVPAVSARDRGDHDRAREAVEAGQILPLKAVLARVEREAPGAQVLEVELERHEALWLYEIKLLQTGGVITKLRVDARTGEPIRRRGERGREGRDSRDNRERD